MSELAYRELYAPGHFGNWYEVMAPYEAEEMLREAKYWGFNAYGDWLDAADLKDPHDNPRREYLLPQVLWERKQEFYRIAQKLGFQTNMVITPNHVYLNQVSPDIAADRKDRRFFGGQLICPSKPKGREIILNNHRNLFKDLRSNGVSLDSISGCPFDYGGCSCSECSPWILTFGKLMVEIHELAREYFPRIQTRLIGWWWTAEEHKMFKEWADSEHKGRFVSLAEHILYGETRPNPEFVLPEGCDIHAFIHIGYAEKANPRDVYGAWGPVIASNRLSRTVYELKGIGCTGFQAYSEGCLDDVNKALLGALSSGKASDAKAVLSEYAERYFGAKGADKSRWASWLAEWGEPFTRDVAKARKEFDQLAKKAQSGWRLKQWEAKLRIFEANAEVQSGKEWDEKRRASAERFFLEREKLFRGLWGLGPVRHVLNARYHPPPWYKEFQAAQAVEFKLEKEQ
ncbi:MAG: hypothetical protein QME62_03445 [Armatimonadota bacterium]|nr:hypothetical protein [Armatimonadota bacterium]